MAYLSVFMYAIIGTLFTVTHANIILQLTAQEEMSGQYRLGNIINKINVSSNWDSPSFRIDTLSEYSRFFSIQPNSDLYLVERINREDICPRSIYCEIGVEIFVTYGTSLEIIDVKVEIIDINDNTPTFTPSVLALPIAEGTQMGTSYELPTVSDLDTGSYSIQSFVLEPNDTNFILESHKNLDGTSVTLNLVLNIILDREQENYYQLTVKAIDGGGLTGELTVTINVTDINDNPPIFNPTQYNTTIDEDIAVGTGIVNVTASDRDIGDNARLAYYFTDPNSVISSIGIREDTGEIYVKEEFDSERGPFELFVEARDHGSPVKRSFQAKVTINVRDINDNAPTIQVTFLTDGRVKENTDIGTPVAHVKVNDADIGVNREADCESDSDSFAIRKFSENTFIIEVDELFDREVKFSYNVTINCSDKGDPPLSTMKTFMVTIDDENDNHPIFDESEYTAEVTENNDPNIVIVRVTAKDLDVGNNGKIVYAIEPFSGSSKFLINPTNGIIQASEGFDRELEAKYMFTVVASDVGNPPLIDVANVTVIIKDLNDNAPKIEGDSYAMSVLENSNISTSIGQIKASDPDSGDNGKISFSIPVQFRSYPFRILDDGTVVTTAVLDREDIDNYQFNVIVSDHGSPLRTSSVAVHVIVLDQNDNAPYVDFPDGENNTVPVAHNTLPDTVISTILADDRDVKENKRLTFRIIKGNEAGTFQLDENTGELRLKKQVSSGDVRLYTLTISIKDRGVPQLDTRATLHVKFFLANDTEVVGAVTGSKGRNILIAIIISCATFVLSVIIIVLICVIRRKDNQKRLYGHKAYDEQKIMPSANRHSNRSSSSKGSHDKMIYPDNNYDNTYQIRKNTNTKKEVSFLDEQDGNVTLEPQQYDPVSTFKAPSPIPSPQSKPYDPNYHQDELPPPPKPERSDDTKQRDLHRMTSLRVHQALIQSQNNNNNNKQQQQQWPQNTQDQETGKGYIGLAMKKGPLDDSHSETSAETVASDSGRGGSDEDIRSNITLSHDTDDSRSPNTSTSHPFYTSESQQPTFSSFHGNSVHKTGPLLSSYLNKPQNNGPMVESLKNSYPMNDLSNPHRGSGSSVNNPHRRYNDTNSNSTQSPRNLNVNNSALPYQNSYTHEQNHQDVNPVSRLSKQNLNYRNSFENENAADCSIIDDDNTTTTSGSYTINDITDDILDSDVNDMFYKPDTFV